MTRSRIRLLPLVSIVLLSLCSPAAAAQFVLQNDGFTEGGSAAYQGGFISGETAASRFVPPGPFPMDLTEVRFLYGESAIQRTITLRIWDDSAGTADPGTQLFTSDYLVTGGSGTFSVIDLSADNVQVSGQFRVGIEFHDSGLPSVARDDDGSINATKNFIDASGIGWIQSNLLGLTGDWVIRATVEDQASTTYSVGGTVSGLNGSLVLQNNGTDDLVVTADGSFAFPTQLADGAAYDVTVASGPVSQNCLVSSGSGTISGANVTNVAITCTDLGTPPSELKIDGFTPGGNAGFQGGFVANEIAAVRLVPPAPTQVSAVRFLFGGAGGLETVRLRIWDDPTGADAPGIELFTEDYLVAASDQALQEIDLSADNVQVSGPFRVGIELLHAGLPSVARDDDGDIDPASNFIFANGIGWAKSSTLGLTGDWIIRAVIPGAGAGPDEPTIVSIDDIGNDQGRQVRLTFAASGQDQAGATTPVLQYEAFRRIDPLPGGAARLAGWEQVGTIAAHAESEYNMIVPTLADSTITDGVHWSAFFVRAATAQPAVFYDAPVDSGYSIDNLAPGIPQNIVLNTVILTWDPSPDADFALFSVYASESPTLDGSAVLIGQTAGTSLDVGGAVGQYLLVTATDFAGNEGEPGLVNHAVAAGAAPSPRVPLTLRPNPFNPATQVSFDLPVAGAVTVRIYDLRGREVDSVLEGVAMAAGPQSFEYRPTLPSGVYLLRVRSRGWVEQAKFTIVK